MSTINRKSPWKWAFAACIPMLFLLSIWVVRNSIMDIHSAVAEGNRDRAMTILRLAPESVNSKTWHLSELGPEVTPLHIASRNGDIDLVKMLVRHGADVDAVDLKERPPLRYAIENDNVETVEFLLKSGAGLKLGKFQTAKPISPLRYAKSIEMVRALGKFNPMISSDVGVLDYAINAGDIDLLKELLAHGAPAEARQYYKDAPALILAAEKEFWPGLLLLLETSSIRDNWQLKDSDLVNFRHCLQKCPVPYRTKIESKITGLKKRFRYPSF